MQKKNPVLLEGIQFWQKQNPVFVLFPQIYPLLKQVAEKWIRDADIIETMCNLLKQCVTTLMDGIRPFTNDMVMLLVQCYEAIPHSCMLDLGNHHYSMLSIAIKQMNYRFQTFENYSIYISFQLGISLYYLPKKKQCNLSCRDSSSI